MNEGDRRESDQVIIDGLVALVQSYKWGLNRLFGLLSLGWFIVGIWWTVRARDYSPLLYNVCVALLWLFCMRTVFVFLWFGFIFGGESQAVGYAGPFSRPGASPAMLEELAVVKFAETEAGVKQAEDEQEELQCSICLCEFEGEDTVRRLPCKHYFHQGCIDGWLRISRACPMCNSDVAKGMGNSPAPAAKPHAD